MTIEDEEESDRDRAEGTDRGENLLQVTASVIVLADERRGTTGKGVGTSGDNDTPCLQAEPLAIELVS
jgi:hypothetical protein